MPTMIAQGATTNTANPVLVLSAITRGNTVTPENLARAGMLLDIYSASWAIYDVSDPTVDSVLLASGTVDPVNDRLSTGRYAPTWTVGDTEEAGDHIIVWTYRFNAGDPPIVVTDHFDVLPKHYRRPGYCTVADLRGEGFTTTDGDDKRCILAIQKATAFVEKVTGRFFEPRYLAGMKVNGLGGRFVLLDQPIIALASATFDTSPFSPADLPIDSSLYRVYSRHITQGLVQPDDRENPKIELFYSSEDLIGRRAPYAFTSLIFPRGQQNVTLEGIFGYTDADGSSTGCTPPLIRHVTMLLAARELYKLRTQRDQREDSQKRWRLLSEQTRDQSYNLEPNKLFGAFTGDAEIDQILAQYVRPPQFGGV